VPEGFVCHEPVSLVDVFPTVTECVGLQPHPDDRDLPGLSCRRRARRGARRTILSEYHAAGAATGAFMIRRGRSNTSTSRMPPQLFDSTATRRRPATWRASRAIRARRGCERQLRRVVDPEAADALAKADQRARIAAFGGARRSAAGQLRPLADPGTSRL